MGGYAQAGSTCRRQSKVERSSECIRTIQLEIVPQVSYDEVKVRKRTFLNCCFPPPPLIRIKFGVDRLILFYPLT